MIFLHRAEKSSGPDHLALPLIWSDRPTAPASLPEASSVNSGNDHGTFRGTVLFSTRAPNVKLQSLTGHDKKSSDQELYSFLILATCESRKHPEVVLFYSTQITEDITRGETLAPVTTIRKQNY